MKIIKGIIFDLGNCLIDFDHNIAARKISRLCAKTTQDIYNFFFDSRLTASFEEGKISPREFFMQVKQRLDLKINYEEFLPIWNEIFFITENNRAVYELAITLRNRFKTALLSNINCLHFDYLKRNFSVFDAFDNLLLSYQLKLKKPDPLIYKEALRILKLSGEEVFYTDDRPELITAARALSIRGFIFKGVEQLKNDLLNSGVNLTLPINETCLEKP